MSRNLSPSEPQSFNHAESNANLRQSHSLPTPRITPVEQAPNSWPLNGPPSYPNNYPAPDSRHSSQQPPGMNGPIYSNNNIPPVPFQQAILPTQAPQFHQQPGAQQPFYPFQMPPYVPAGITVDPNVYLLVLMDVMKSHGLVPPWNAPPPQGPGMQNGMHPVFFPSGIPTMNPSMHSQPPGLIPVAPDQSRSPSPVSDLLPPSLSRIPSVLKGKGKVTHVPRGSSASSRAVARPPTSADKIFT